MGFTATPLDGSSPTPIPMSSVIPDGTNTPVPLEGGPGVVTGGNTIAPVSVWVKDGNDIALGFSTDAANANSVIGQLKQIKTNTASITIGSLAAGTNTIGGVELVDSGGTNKASISAGGALKVDNSAVTQPVSVSNFPVTQPVSGTVTANAGTGNFTVVQATGTNLHAVLDTSSTTAVTQATGTNLHTVVDSGTVAATQSGTWTVQPGNTANTTAWKVDASSTTVPVSGTFWQATQPISGTVTSNAGTGNFTVVQATGTNLHVVADSGSTTAVTSLPAIPTGANTIGAVTQASGPWTANMTQIGSTNIVTGGASGLMAVGGPVASGASNADNPVKAGGVFNTTQPTVTTGQIVDSQYTARGAALVATGVDAFAVNASQTGTWTVQPGNTANTTAWKVDGSAVTQPVSAASLPLPTGAATLAKQPALGTAGTASPDVLSVQGIASMTALKVDGSGVTQPVSGTFWQTTQPVSGTVTANIGTTNGIALDTSVNGVIVAQSSTTAGEKGTLIQGAVTTGSPTYTTAQTNPISLTTAGAIRVDASATTQPISGTVAATQSGTWTVQPGNTANTTAWKVDGSAVTQPVSGTFWQATQPISGTVTANAGTNLNTSALALDTSVNGVLVSQGSTTSGEKGPIIQGAVTTAAPTYTTAQTNPLSLDTAGLLRASLKDTPSNTNNFNVNLAASAATVTVSATNLQTNLNQIAGSAIATAATGIMKVGLTDGTGTAITSTSNALDINIKSGGGSGFSITDEAAWTAGASAFVPTGGVFNDTAAALTTGQEGAIRLTNNRAIHSNLRDASGNQLLGSKTSANSVPVVVASDQGAVSVSGTVTANAGTGNFTVTQATGTNLHAVLDSGSTTAATQATAANLNAQVVGSVASAGANAGNPIKTGGVFNTTQPTVTNGQIVDLQSTARGAQIVATGADTFTVTATQATGTNLHVVNDAGSAVIGSTTIQATSGTALVADQTNTELRVSNYVKTTTAGDTALTLGSATSVNSLPVVIASDQAAVASKLSAVAAYTLASTTTTGSTQNSSDIAVGPYREISIDINTTAQAGTSPTIQYFYERKGADGIYYVLWQSAVLTVAANTLSTSIGAGMAYNQSLGVTGRLRWVVGGSATPTYTHSLNIQGK